eukprot:gene14348-1678_t
MSAQEHAPSFGRAASIRLKHGRMSQRSRTAPMTSDPDCEQG